MNVRRRVSAFTFIEVLLAIVLIVALFGSALWFYRHIGEVRNSVSDEMQKVVAQRLVMERITRELRSSQAVPFVNVGVDGKTDQITFITTALPGRAIWAAQNVADTPLPPEQDIRLVTYGLRYVEDEDGLTYIAGIETEVQKLLTAQVVEETNEASEEEANSSVLLSPYVRFVRFRYWNGTEWLDEWAGQGLPLAIEVGLGEEPLPENVEPEQYEFRLSRRIVSLPTATPPSQTGDIILGLGGGR